MSSASKDFEEKRNFIRMFVDAKVTITDPVTGNVYQGDSKNLSGDGILIQSNQEFQLNQELNVDISSDKSKMAPLSAQFVVKRVEKLENGMFEVGGAIKDVT